MRKHMFLYTGTSTLLAAALLVGCGSTPADSTPTASESEAASSSEAVSEPASEATADTAAADLDKLFADNSLQALLAKYDTVTTTTEYTYGDTDTAPMTSTAQYTTKDGRFISHGTSQSEDAGDAVYATYADSEETGVYLYSSADSKLVTVYDGADVYDQNAIAFLPSAADAAYMTVTNVSEQDGATLIETETVIEGQRSATGIYYVDPETGNLLADTQSYYDGDTVVATALTNYDYTTAYEDTDNLYSTLLNVDGGRKVTIVSGANTGSETSRTLTVASDTLVNAMSANDDTLYADIEGKEPIFVVEPGTEDVTAYLLPSSNEG